jgi:hypothetical protein
MDCGGPLVGESLGAPAGNELAKDRAKGCIGKESCTGAVALTERKAGMGASVGARVRATFVLEGKATFVLSAGWPPAEVDLVQMAHPFNCAGGYAVQE